MTNDIHRDYEHEVTLGGKRCFDLIASFARPESIDSTPHSPSSNLKIPLRGNVDSCINQRGDHNHGLKGLPEEPMSKETKPRLRRMAKKTCRRTQKIWYIHQVVVSPVAEPGATPIFLEARGIFKVHKFKKGRLFTAHPSCQSLEHSVPSPPVSGNGATISPTGRQHIITDTSAVSFHLPQYEVDGVDKNVSGSRGTTRHQEILAIVNIEEGDSDSDSDRNMIIIAEGHDLKTALLLYISFGTLTRSGSMSTRPASKTSKTILDCIVVSSESGSEPPCRYNGRATTVGTDLENSIVIPSESISSSSDVQVTDAEALGDAGAGCVTSLWRRERETFARR
ncbi:uncharacterized protein PG998_004550 [Apiospora kogelbergensis]|uniref:uncharacterized protein n=1 Tax=Apiospora kogelbergensis TaxID=1337665 RepID=UPI0031305CA5